MSQTWSASNRSKASPNWSGVDWSGVDWSGVSWSGLEWIGVDCVMDTPLLLVAGYDVVLTANSSATMGD